MYINLIILIVSIIYMILEGYREAFYWHYNQNASVLKAERKLDIHFWFAMQRGMFFIITGICVLLNYINTEPFYLSILYSFINTILLMGMFSFIHNGIYYRMRDILTPGVYPLRFKAQSETSSAKMTKFFTYKIRSIIFVLCFLAYIIFSIFV